MAKKSKTPRPPRSVQKRERRQTRHPNRSPQPPANGGGLASRAARYRWHLGAAGAAIAVIAVALVIAATGSARPVYVNFGGLPGLQNGPPPWNNGIGQLPNDLAALHVDPLSQEALAFHIHQHLDLYLNGTHITVPAGIGIDSTFITEVHTHQPDGIIHVESPSDRPYTLGQFFGEWNLRLTANCLGRYCGTLHWWVDGHRQIGDPAHLVLRPHQEIVIAAGRPPAHIPAAYDFPAGY
jgi:hypothetical protein